MAALDNDTIAAKVALQLIRSDLAEKYPEAAATIDDDFAAKALKMAKVKSVKAPPDPGFPACNVSGYCWYVSCRCIVS